jgi:hypothetical protein
MTTAALADKYIAAKAVLDAAEAVVKELKKEIAALGVEQIEGARGFVKIGLGQRNTLDGKAVEAELGAQWVKDHTKQGAVYEILTIKAKPIKVEVAKQLAELAS